MVRMSSTRTTTSEVPAPRTGPAGSADSAADRNPYLPFALRIGADWSWRLLLLVAAAAVLVKLAGPLSTILVAVAVAALLAGLLSPIVVWLRQHKVGAGLSTAIAELGAIVAVLALLALVGQQLVTGIAQMSDQLGQGFQQLMSWLENGPLHLSVSQINQYVTQASETLKENSSSIASGAAKVGSTASDFGEGLLICLFTLIFFLHEGERIWLFLVGLFPQRARPAVNGAGRRGWHSLVSYTRVQVLVAFIDAVGIGAGAFILGVPLAFPLGVLVFVSSFIPIIGALVSGCAAVLLALVANGPVNAIIMLGVVLLVQQVESHILQPLVMGRAVSVHPLAVVLSVAAGTTVLGIVGALFAVPFVAVANTVVRYLARREWERDDDLRTEPFQFDWEREKAQAKARKKIERAGIKEKVADALPTGGPKQKEREEASAESVSPEERRES